MYQKGYVHVLGLLLALAVLGLVIFFLASSVVPLKSKLFSTLYPKPSSFASTNHASLDTNNTSYDLGVLVIKYFPQSGENIDISVTGDVGEPYLQILQKTIDITNNLLIYMPKATTYLNSGTPAINLHVVDTKQYNVAVPIAARTGAPTYPDYSGIMTSNNICHYVDDLEVREVWLFAYQGPNIPGNGGYPYLGISESKMSGPYGDVSNSPRLNDMPICTHTYRVYTFNYGRGTGEAIHSWGHQLEAEFTSIDDNLFRVLWQGPNYPTTLAVTGRCGSVHNPPNAAIEYDYHNTSPHQSDCLNWNPDGPGTLSNISCNIWGCADLGDNNNPQLNYIVWNWQHLPGKNNSIVYQGKTLRNWWDIHADWDYVMADAAQKKLSLNSLIVATPTPTPAATSAATNAPTSTSSPTPTPSAAPTSTPAPTASPTPKPTAKIVATTPPTGGIKTTAAINAAQPTTIPTTIPAIIPTSSPSLTTPDSSPVTAAVPQNIEKSAPTTIKESIVVSPVPKPQSEAVSGNIIIQLLATISKFFKQLFHLFG